MELVVYNNNMTQLDRAHPKGPEMSPDKVTAIYVVKQAVHRDYSMFEKPNVTIKLAGHRKNDVR